MSARPDKQTDRRDGDAVRNSWEVGNREKEGIR